MAEHLVGAPLFAELDGGAFEVPVILFELAFESREQRERVTRSSRKSRHNLIVVKAPDLFRAGLHDSLAERHLPVPSECDVSVFPNKEDSSATHPVIFVPHVLDESTIGIRLIVSQG